MPAAEEARGNGWGSDQPVFLVVGATGGIGSALSRALADRGAVLLLASRTEDDLAALAEELDGSGVGGAVSTMALDATEVESVEAAAREALEHAGRLDGIANCAGSLLLKPVHLTSPEEWRETMEANLTTAYAAVRAAARVFPDRRGSVVLTSTAAVRTGLPNHEAIAAAKGGVEGLVRSAAATYGSGGLRVNAVAPGLVRTPLTRRITGSEKAAEKSRQMHALGRLGEPEDVASAMEWLLDPAQRWVTGQVLGVDGGLGSVRPRIGA